MNRLITYLLLLLCFYGCKKHPENKLHTYLTNDSLSMWDMPIIEKRNAGGDDTYVVERTISFLFDENHCYRFNVGYKGRRIAQKIGPKVNLTGLCNKWEILNDSTVKLNCKDVFVIKIISKDTLHLIDTLGVKQHEMYRVQPPWNIDEESVKIRDKQVESGKYLDKRVY